MNRPLTLDLLAYAGLVAELAVRPERRAELLAERGLTEADVADAERGYAARFVASPGERTKFERLVAGNRARLDPAAHAEPEEPDLDRTAEMSGAVLAASLPFRPATSADAAFVAPRPAPPAPADDGAKLDGTGEAPGAVLAPPLPFQASSAAVAPEGGAVVTSFPWRAGDGRIRTTVVAKVSFYLQVSGPPVLVPPDPLVAFDRIAGDPRFIEAASETAPWTVSPSIILYGGPLRFTFHPTSGDALQLWAAAGVPVGWSMSNPERARYAPRPPTRGADGILTIPEGTDGRYFLATPPTQRPLAIAGDERVVLELQGARFDVRLPAILVVVTVDAAQAPGGSPADPRRRSIALPFDTLAVHGERRRISLIGRATFPGEITLVGHRLASPPGVAAAPASAPQRKSLASTAALDASTALRAAGRPVMPFESDRRAGDPYLAPAPPPDDGPEPAPARIEARVAAEPEAPKPPPKPVIARPKPGAMAKPRIKKR